MPEDEVSNVDDIERVINERFYLVPLIPPSGVFAAGLGVPEVQTGLLWLAAKLVAIQRIHGADDDDLKEYLSNFLGLRELSAGNHETVIIQLAYNLLAGCERLFTGMSLAEVKEQFLANQVVSEDMAPDTAMRRTQEIYEYCQATGIGPFDHETDEDIPATPKMPYREGLALAFKRLYMGYRPEEVERELLTMGVDIDIEMLQKILLLTRAAKENQAGLRQLTAEFDDEHRRQFEVANTEAAKVIRSCDKQAPHRLLTKFVKYDEMIGKAGCFQVPIAVVTFVALLFTPLSWWMSLIVAFVLLYAMVLGRKIWEELLAMTIAGKIKALKPGTEDYADVYRLFCSAQDWPGYMDNELPKVIKRLEPVDVSLKPQEASEDTKPFHAFYYTTDESGGIKKLAMRRFQKAAFQDFVLGDGWTALDEETYWREHFIMIHSAMPRCYVAWDGRIHWIVQSSKEEDKYGVHVIEITSNKLRYKWLDYTGDDLPPRLQNLIEVPWNWQIEGVGCNREAKMSPVDMKLLTRNIGWTDELHQRMNQKFPFEEIAEQHQGCSGPR